MRVNILLAKKWFLVLMIAALAVAVLWLARVPLASGQDAHPVKVEFTAYEGNPVILKGAAGEWDSDIVWEAAVLRYENVFHMFYIGNVMLVGYATSEDGLHWTEYADNPILEADPELSPGGFGKAIPLVEGDSWSSISVTRYLAARTCGGRLPQPLRAPGRLTASRPLNPMAPTPGITPSNGHRWYAQTPSTSSITQAGGLGLIGSKGLAGRRRSMGSPGRSTTTRPPRKPHSLAVTPCSSGGRLAVGMTWAYLTRRSSWAITVGRGVVVEGRATVGMA